jgi:hypothetical protein
MPRPKKQKSHLSKARRLRKCEQKVKELSASAVEVIMQRHSQFLEEELVRVQGNRNADAEITGELSNFEKESELEYTDEEYLSEDDLEPDSEEVNRPVLSTTIPDGIETLVEHEKPNASTMLMDDVQTDSDFFSSVLQTAANVIRMIQRFDVNCQGL